MSDQNVSKLATRLAKSMRDHRREIDNAVIKEMLGRWVSEMEPFILYGPSYTILGLASKGASVPSIHVIYAPPPSEMPAGDGE